MLFFFFYNHKAYKRQKRAVEVGSKPARSIRCLGSAAQKESKSISVINDINNFPPVWQSGEKGNRLHSIKKTWYLGITMEVFLYFSIFFFIMMAVFAKRWGILVRDLSGACLWAWLDIREEKIMKIKICIFLFSYFFFFLLSPCNTCNKDNTEKMTIIEKERKREKENTAIISVYRKTTTRIDENKQKTATSCICISP